MNDDWDLHAVVRGCSAARSAPTTTATTTGTSNFTADSFVSASLATETFSRNSFSGDLIYKTFENESSFSFPSSSSSSLACLDLRQQPEELMMKQNKRPFSVSVSPSTSTNRVAVSNTSRSKRRKIQQKRVCHVPAEALNSDVWAWRKYGQKPIKGSPYPRGYYKCSTSKSCLARKQVERNRSDPTMFILTFTAEHNHPAPAHRNSLAGSTRPKSSSSDQPPAVSNGACDSTAGSSSSPATSPDNFVLPVSEHLEADEDLNSMTEETTTALSDDFFEGLDGFGAGDSFSGDSPACFGLPWLSDDAVAAAGGGFF